MKHDTEHQLRELIRNVIREELKSREVKKDTETGITTSDLEDKEGKKVGYMKHKELPTGGFVAVSNYSSQKGVGMIRSSLFSV